MSAIAAHPRRPISANDRLSLTLFLAAAIHGVIILGVGFQSELGKLYSPPSLDVVLVQNRTEEVPDKADYLAQANQEGGGSVDERLRPTSPFSSPQRSNETGISPLRVEQSSPEQNQEAIEILTTRFAEQKMQNADERAISEAQKKRRSAEEIERSLEIARLTAEIDREVQAYAKRPRKKFVHARTRESAAAAYMHEWVKQIERVGNLNYPDRARRDKLNGSLVLVVGINANGSLNEIVLRSSSGHQILDDAARRIVSLASPYAPFPASLKKDTDILYITRTWQFLSDNRLVTR